MKWLFQIAVLFVSLCVLSIWVAAQQSALDPSSNTGSHQESGIGKPPAPAFPVNDSLSDISSEPRIGAGDLLKISVLGSPEFDQEVRVGGEGKVYVALLGKVAVVGLTTELAGALIRQQLIEGGYFTDPQVSVFQKEYATQGISVMGEVQKPGVYPILGPRRLFDALALAGGTTPKAGRAISITHRDRPNFATTVSLSRDSAENMKANVEVLPGDTVVVSKAGVVYVVGAVRLPSGIVMENGGNISVLQAIAVAGGTSPNAALNGSRIIRKTAAGPQEIPIKLKKILGAKSPDVTLQSEDIVFVPQSTGKRAAGLAAESIVRIAASVASYSVFY